MMWCGDGWGNGAPMMDFLYRRCGSSSPFKFAGPSLIATGTMTMTDLREQLEACTDESAAVRRCTVPALLDFLGSDPSCAYPGF